MLTALHLESFKAVAARQRIDLAPLTVLFGPNGAGKSTILLALLYLHELLVRGNPNVDRTELGGATLELGGFARLVHGHDLARTMVLRADFATPRSLDRFRQSLDRFPFPDLDDEVESAWVELTLRMRTTATHDGPIVERVAIGVTGSPEPLVWLEVGASLRPGEPLHARIDLGHPRLAHAGPEVRERFARVAIPEPVLPPSGVTRTADAEHPHPCPHDPRRFPVFAVSRARPSALPPLDEPLRVIPFGGFDDEDDHPDERAAIAREIRTLLEMVVLGTTAQLAASLQASLYVGPWRTLPPRGHLYERFDRSPSWADGRAAWERLLADRSTLVERTNEWLQRLGTGCRVVVQPLFDPTASAEELSRDDGNRTTRRLLLDTGAGPLLLPFEASAGVARLIPVIVATLHGRNGIPLIEQPELHVDPSLQGDLGDLFIEAAAHDGKRPPMLVETHSEHLVHRLLRRIHQTTDGTLPEHAPSLSAEQLGLLHVENHPDGLRIRRLRPADPGAHVEPSDGRRHGSLVTRLPTPPRAHEHLGAP